MLHEPVAVPLLREGDQPVLEIEASGPHAEAREALVVLVVPSATSTYSTNKYTYIPGVFSKNNYLLS